MPTSTIVSAILVLVSKAPSIYEDVKYALDLLVSGKEPSTEDMEKIKSIIDANEKEIDSH